MTSVLDRYPNLRTVYSREPIVFAALRTADDLGLSDGQALAECVVDLSAALAEARERLREASAPAVMVVRQGIGSGWPRRKCVECDGRGIVWAADRGHTTAVRCARCNGRGER